MPGHAIPVLAFALMAAQAPSIPSETLFERGRYREVLDATAGSRDPRDRAARIRARIALLELDEAPQDLFELIDEHLGQQAVRFGTSSLEYGEALLWRGVARKSLDDLARARALCAGHVESTCEGEAVGRAGFLLASTGQSAEGARQLNEAWELHRARLGPEHPLTGNAEALLARHCLGNPDQSCRPHAEHALEVLRKSAGPDHPYLINALWSSSRVLATEGDGRRALVLLQEALRIATAAYGERSTRLLNVLGDLAVAYQMLGEPANAVAAAHRAVDIAEARVGPDHLVTAIFLGMLGNTQVDEGDIAGGLRSIAHAVAIHERTSPEGFELAASLTLLGDVQVRAGDFAAARRQLERARTLFTRLTGDASFRVIHVRLRLGEAALALGEPANALREYDQALVAARRDASLDGVEVEALLGRAESLVALGRFDDAQKDLDDVNRRVTEDGPIRARIHDLLARRHVAERRWQDALVHARAALDAFRVIAGPESIETVGPLARLAQAHAALGQRAEALAAALESEAVRRRVQSEIAAGLPERPALSAGIQVASLPVLTELAVSDPATAPRVWDAIIRNRALVMDAVGERARIARSSDDPALRRQAAALADARAALAKAVLRGRGTLSADGYAGDLLRLRERAEQAEFALADLSAPFRNARLELAAGFPEMVRRLPAQTAVVGYVHVEARYVAFVTQGTGAVAVDLGPASVLESLVRNWRLEIDREMNAGGRSAVANERRATAAGRALRRVAWDPLRPHLNGAARVLIVPDGALSMVNFAALPAPGGAYLVESGPLVHLLSTERDLLAAQPARTGSGLLAVGDPAFETGRAGQIAARRGAGAVCEDVAASRFAALPGAAAEVRGVVEAWRLAGSGSSESLTGTAATKGAFAEKAEGKEVLHLATHGFFVPKSCRADDVVEQNPLLRAGIALSGANDRAARDAGILMAAEIAGLRLDGTAWVVLSGCDTGAGDVLVGEGVLGLRRAFQTAGARSVIASLWPVEDDETRRWMVALYSAHFQQKHDTAEAVRAAQRARLRARRRAGASTHPFYWAGFVAVGDWR